MSSIAILHEVKQLYNVSDRLDSLAELHPVVSAALITISGSVRNTATLLEVLVATKITPLSQRLLKVQDEERWRVARDLHDSTGQTLAALKMSIAVLEERLKRNQCTSDVLSEIAALADQAIQEIRSTSYPLHPPLLDEAGFNSAAQWYVDGFGKRSGIKVRLDLATKRERLPITIETALFRVLQESLTNVHRHSGALEVSIRFQYQAETVLLEIRDCGRGIPMERLTRLREASSETGVGLAGMRERLTELNGRLEIESRIVMERACEP
jgi:two-component system NarL family sensor kinase